MTTAVDPDNTPIEGTVFTPRQVRLLKVAVVAMGLMILVGLGAVIVGMIYQASKVGKKPVSAAPAAVESGIAEAGALTVPEGSKVTTMALDGNRLAVHLTTPDGGEIAIVDLTTGAVLSRLELRTGKAPAQ
ncbi:MAG: hypothetical protein A49_10260 [Methyloceanibacter sp.]|nr:MAG: hypothetical protein A49_10260 [Methyloceanibacter sp.]